jgi:uncharacterized Zn-binding protein involved in type VI secretion
MSNQAARVFDKVQHPLPGMLMPGPGAANVLIGNLPAWRGLPAAAAAALQAAKAVSDAVVTAAEAAKTAAMGTPGAPAAIAAEQAAKAAATAAMSSLMNGLAAACAALGGTPDTHVCATPGIPPPPHGPGMVIDGSSSVLINGLPACAVGDNVLEALGPLDPIVLGMTTVFVGKPGGAGGGGGLLRLIARAIAAFLGGLSSLADAAKDIVQFANKLIKAVVDAILERAERFAKALIDSVVDTLKRFAAEFARGVTSVYDAVVPSRVPGMKASEADKAIQQAQKDAVEALNDRIADIDKWDAQTRESFKKWFGADDQATRQKMRERAVKARDKIESFTLDNYARDDDAFAYVYPDKDDKMYLGEQFAGAPETGRDSKAGTLVHEASHYDSVGSTDDVEHDGQTVYGEAGAEKLAKEAPEKAQENADNFEYFIEDGM